MSSFSSQMKCKLVTCHCFIAVIHFSQHIKVTATEIHLGLMDISVNDIV